MNSIVNVVELQRLWRVSLEDEARRYRMAQPTQYLVSQFLAEACLHL